MKSTLNLALAVSVLGSSVVSTFCLLNSVDESGSSDRLARWQSRVRVEKDLSERERPRLTV